jgi:hypothetical protein
MDSIPRLKSCSTWIPRLDPDVQRVPLRLDPVVHGMPRLDPVLHGSLDVILFYIDPYRRDPDVQGIPQELVLLRMGCQDLILLYMGCYDLILL